ncbi:hypothetical protein IFM89_000380 [Coptis chinensis]|uniref:Nuclear pore complex protein n=1 Tax=Coptis chinensis TaxID=261450 RepID=A0A835LK55_9MAGN|nr:hypothetical protein IFM89_000380 [Coptis chinensis]
MVLHVILFSFIYRAEIDRLTELLHSRTVHVSAVEERKRLEPSTSRHVEAPGEQEIVPVQENELKKMNSSVRNHISRHIEAPGEQEIVPVQVNELKKMNSSFLEENVSSPVELAKAYMGRPSKVTPSTLGLHNQASRGDVSRGTTIPFSPMSHSRSLVPAPVHNASVSKVYDSGYLTPVPRGRSAVYSMAHTPSSRFHQTASLKGVQSMTEGNAGPSTSSQRSWEANLLNGAKQASKRRISVLDSDIGSVDSIRRTRRKTNMMSPSDSLGLSIHRSSLPISSALIGTDATKGHLSSVQNQLRLDGHKHNASSRALVQNGKSSIASKRFVSVPSHSTEMANKILQQLDKLVPSPKEKSYERKTATLMETSPSKLTDGGAGDFMSRKQARVDGTHLKHISDWEEKVGPESSGLVTTRLKYETTSSLNTAIVASSSSLERFSQKKQGFEEIANKDSPELEKNKLSSRIGCNPSVVSVKDKKDTPVVESKEIVDGTVTVGNPPGIFTVKKSRDTGASDNYRAIEKEVGFTYPVTSATSTVVTPALATSMSPSSFDRTSSANQPTDAGLLTSVSKSVEKAALFTFSSESVSGESSRLNGIQSEAKLETVSSTFTPSSGECSNTIIDGDLLRQSNSAVSLSKSASITPGIFSFSASASSSLINGLPASSSSPFSVPAFSVPATVPISGKPAGNDLFASPSSTSYTTTSLKVSAAPMFEFGSSISAASAPANSASVISTSSGLESTESELKTSYALSFDNLKSSPIGSTTPAFAGSSNGKFVFGDPSSLLTNLSCDNNQSQNYNSSSAASGSLSCVLAAPGTVSAPFTQSVPNQLDSFTSSKASVFSTGGSPFASSVPGANLFASGSLSTLSSSSSSTFSMTTSSFTSKASSTSSLLEQSSTSSVFGTGFNFGSSSAVSATMGSVATGSSSSLGSPAGSIFSFTSAAPVTTAPMSRFGSASPGNDQMIEDSMTEDTVQASTALASGFAQPTIPPQANSFAFTTPSSGGLPLFQFGSQQNPATPQTLSPFQPPGSLGFSGGGSFSLGTGGSVDKSNRRIFKARRKR